MAELPNNDKYIIVECDHCNTSSEVLPVIKYIYQGEEKHVCVHCLPMLIHG